MTPPPSERTLAVLEQLQQLPLCEPMNTCDPEGLRAMAEIGHIERYDADVQLFAADEKADCLRFVVSGRVALSFEHPGTKALTIASISPGDMMGWSSLRENATWTFSARTTKPTRCVAFPGDELRALCDQNREFGYCLMRFVFEVVADRLVDARVQLLDLYGRRA